MYEHDRGWELPADERMRGAVETMEASRVQIASLRGMTDTAADVSECCCPDDCERDHANE